jgi:glycosyltransferase involved in cell wall biosynthesis
MKAAEMAMKTPAIDVPGTSLEVPVSVAQPRPALPLSVIIPTRNAEAFLPGCLASVVAAGPVEVIVVDGCSTDATVAIAESYGARVLSDEGAGVAAARMIGVRAASQPVVALVDSDVVIPEGALARLLEEFTVGGFKGLQAGLRSVSGPGYWGRALASHHNSGRSRHWFGLAATIVDRSTLLEHPLDAGFVSGEDIDLRWRLARAGRKIGVSELNFVTHRFGDSLEFARGQFRADGAGLARMVVGHRGGARLLLLPIAAAARGMAVTTLQGRPGFIPYYAAYGTLNYASMIGTMWAIARGRDRRDAAGPERAR